MKMFKKKGLSLFFSVGLLFSFIPLCRAGSENVILKEVNSLDPVIEMLKTADKDTLVIFDVDYVLLVPKALIARPISLSLRRILFPKLKRQVGQERFEYLLSILRSQSGSELVDPRLPWLIQGLQSRAIKVIAVTAQGYGPLGIIKDEGRLRVEELRRLSLDFRTSFPSLNSFLLKSRGRKKHLPLYRDGIIFTDRSSKGDALIAFLEKLQWTPKKIIVIDDGRNYLEQMKEALERNHLSGILFHYVDQTLALEKSNSKMIQMQLDYLIKTGKWLTDEDAYTQLEELN